MNIKKESDLLTVIEQQLDMLNDYMVDYIDNKECEARFDSLIDHNARIRTNYEPSVRELRHLEKRILLFNQYLLNRYYLIKKAA